ncbi:MAG: hypothetical protein Q9157_005375 [Trypethelium eluteriae]
MPLNNNTAAICCPQGQDCNVIQPINCDTSLQNATLNPSSSLHSTDLSSQLPSCGSNLCCPLGYTCQDNGCWMDKDNANATNQTSTSAPPSPVASYTASVAHPSGTSPAGDTSSSPAPSSSSGITPGGAAAVAFFPALLVGAALAFLGLWLYNKRRERAAGKPKEIRHSDSLSHTTRNVSDPIYDPRYGNRTDFLASGRSVSDYTAEMSGANPYAVGSPPRGQPGSGGGRSGFSFEPSPPARTPGTSTSDRVRSIFGRSPRGSSALSPPSGGPGTRGPPPPIMTQRHNSGETIDVLMPPQPSYGNEGGGFGLTPPAGNSARNTTFSSMMEQAGFKRSDLTGRDSESNPRSGGNGGGRDGGSARAPAVSPRSRY